MSTDKNNRITETDIRGLEHRLEELIRTCQRLKEETRLLRQQQTTPVSIQILEKEFLIACPADEREALMAAAGYLGKKMKEIRDSGKVVGADRIAVIAALNITHELLKARSENEFHSDNLGSRIRALQNKIDAALHDSRQMDL